VNDYEAVDEDVSEPEWSFPWPPAEGESIVNAFARTWREASLHARAFFTAMPHDDIRSALVYYLLIGIAVAGATLFWTTVLSSMPAGGMLDKLGGGGMSPIIEFLLSPLILLLSIFIASGVTHLLLMMFGGAHNGYKVTLRVFAFAYSPQILGVIPVVGQLAGFVWMIIIAIVGLSAAHNTGTGRAAAAVLLPVFVGVLMMVLVAAFFLAAGGLVGLTPHAR
jgi:hypothetical protein